MRDIEAVLIADGQVEADEPEVRAAWQHLEDTGLGYRLQGWFGRRLTALIEAGYVTPAKGPFHDEED